MIAQVVRAAIMGLRVTPEGRTAGLDYTQHGESAYEIHN